MTEYVIITENEDGGISVTVPADKSLSIDEIAILSLPELRQQLDVINLGVSNLSQLIGEKEIDIEVEEIAIEKVNNKKVRKLIKRTKKVKAPDYAILNELEKHVNDKNIVIGYNRKDVNSLPEYYTQETPRAFLQRKSIDEIKAIKPYVVVRKEDMPTDKKYRKTWKLQGDKVVIDIEKAKEIKLERIRKARNAKLEQLDKQFMIAERDNADTQELKELRQRLKDIPNDATEKLNAAVTVEDLENLWYDELN